VGEIVDQLKTVPTQMSNTIIIFSSDNGAPPATPDVNHKVRHSASVQRARTLLFWLLVRLVCFKP
jgi:arylsulfatase A-like enzyme